MSRNRTPVAGGSVALEETSPVAQETHEEDKLDASTGLPAAFNRIKEERPNPPVKYFRVMNGGTVMWEGGKTPVRAGKIYCETAVDIKALIRQGIILEEIQDPNLL